jgi:rhodanese-related sulfurtransferase
MGNQVSLVPKVSYEDIQMVVYRNTHIPHSTLIINTLPPSLQHCLIKTTVDIQYEEQIVNTMIHKNRDIMIIVYGKNSNDITILHKYEQLVKLGFTNVHIYTGGIFEWMLLYEIYGKDLFKITRYEIDILRYRPKSVLLGAMMGGGGGAGAGAGGYIEDIPRSHDVRINIPASADEDVSNHDTHTPENSNGSLFTGLKWLFS